MERKRYYVIWCTSDENQVGTFHYSGALVSEKQARKVAERKRKLLGGDGHVSIELHREVFEHNEWRLIDTENRIEHVDYI